MTDLFANTNNTPTIDPNKNYLEELVGDGKKFKSVEDLARAKAEADAFIERLKGEQEGLRTELNTRLTLEQYMEKINSGSTNQNQTPNPDTNTNGGNGNGAAALTPDQIEELLNNKINEREQKRIQDQNLATVRNELTRLHGNDYVAKLRELQQSIGADDAFIQNLAKTNPQALLRMVGGGQTQQPQKTEVGLFAPPPSQTTNFVPSSNKRDWNFYEDLRKKNPSDYWSPSIQNQLHKDAMDLGEAFYPR